MSLETAKLERKLQENLFEDQVVNGCFYSKARHGVKIAALIMDDLDTIKANRNLPYSEIIEKLHLNGYKERLV